MGIHIVHCRGEVDTEFANASRRVFFFFPEILRGSDLNPFSHVARRLHSIGRMRFPDIDQEEFNLPFVLLSQSIESANLRPKWRSSVAAEYERHRTAIPKAGERDAVFLVHDLQVEIGRHVANLELAGPVAKLVRRHNRRDL